MQSSPDGPYKFILNYQDHLTKFVLLRPLVRKSAEDVAVHLVDIWHDKGAPMILQADNGKEFDNKVLKTCCNLWKGLRIVHGKPRHSQSQGSIERANQDVQNMLATWMADEKSTHWSLGLSRVQFMKNSSYHAGIKRTPYEAMYGVPAKVGLAILSLPEELLHEVTNEEELEKLVGIQSVELLDGITEEEVAKSFEEIQQQQLTNTPSEKKKHQQAPAPLLPAFQIQLTELSPVQPLVQEDEILESSLVHIQEDESPESLLVKSPIQVDQPPESLPAQSLIQLDESPESLLAELSPAQSLIQEDEPPESLLVELPPAQSLIQENQLLKSLLNSKKRKRSRSLCEVCEGKNSSANNICISKHRREAKENLELQANKMLRRSKVKFPKCNVGDCVRVPVPDVDRGRGDERNILLSIVSIEDNDLYKLGNEQGTINQKFSRNQFTLCKVKFVDPTNVSTKCISLREIAREQSLLGGQGYTRCNCTTGCSSKKCKCIQAGVLCNSKCHKSLTCKNKNEKL